MLKDVQMYKRGQIYWWKDESINSTALKPGVIRKSRPVLIVSNDVGLSCSGIATVVPLTTSRKRKICVLMLH